ncbi:hypothetical protein [Treponema brennaborense]|uniref:Outer membrane protein beta-barrel domain-containing protein n=1 Tax=Treponema brennaborense (strain DSM 12168 / CIP 105900 / DD5/3) TaxID=906968 RepID=F4LMU8_TREBD|nr:hypothetical protein [Treponema brennaborense]AEE17838.1 hypothetical protein Trebr_2431 [Treponema brennaborense DSM 12168]
MSCTPHRVRFCAAAILLLCVRAVCIASESDEPVLSGETAVPGITWTLERSQGVQSVARVAEGSGGLLFSPGTSYLEMQYRGMILTVWVSDLFFLKTVLNVGFLQNEVPTDFSITTLPYLDSEWTSVESETFVIKSFPVTYRSGLAFFAGYSMLQYTLNDREDRQTIREELVYHSLLLGAQISFRPIRFITMEYGVSFSPFSRLDFSSLSVFQLNYEISTTVSAGILSFTYMITTRNNIEYAANSENLSSLRVAETSLRFQIRL